MKPGTASHDGLPRAFPSAELNSLLVTGLGAVALTGPEMDSFSSEYLIIPTTSSLWIHENHCLPLPIGPPKKFKRNYHLGQRPAVKFQYTAYTYQHNANA